MISDIAALYVDPRGPYPKLLEHWWDETRDARNYAGPWPVVAHPPCGPWSSLRHLHTRPEERELGLLAIEQVSRWGGVLEQPADSLLFDRIPMGLGHVVEVCQVAWGHVARKRTWLWFVGVEPVAVHSTRRAGGTPTHWCSGGRNCQTGGSVPPGIKVCSAQQRRRTPIAFAEWLISLAQQAARRAP